MSSTQIREKLHQFIEQADDRLLNMVFAMMEADLGNEIELDPSIEKEMKSRALKSEQDIKEGKVYTIEEAEARLNKRLGL